MSKRHEALGIFKHNQITEKGKEQLQFFAEHRYKIADDCERLIHTTKTQKLFLVDIIY